MKNRTSATLLPIVLSASATVAAESDAAHESILPGHGECPELFELPVGGDKHNTRWIPYGGTGDYDIGTFDGHQFSKESGTQIYAFANLKSCGFFDASLTWSNAPDERRIQIATCWTRAGVPADMPFTQGMFFPVALNLRSTPDGLRMCRGQLRILKDRTTVEIFGGGGVVYMPIFALFDQERRSFQVTVAKGTCLIERLAVNTLKSIWKK